MKKFEFLLIMLAILSFAILTMMLMAGTPDDGAHGAASTGVARIWPGMVENQTAIMTDHVIGIARSDPVVQKILNSCDNVSGPNYLPPGKADVYLYNNDRYACVIFNASAGPRFAGGPPGGSPISMTVVVDVATMKEMGVLYRGIPSFMYGWIIIPPGNGVYEMMGHWYTVSSPDNRDVPEISSPIGNLNVTPADAKLCPIVLDEDNLKKFLNGSYFEVPHLIDPETGKTIRLDGTVPVSSGLKSTYILPPEVQPYDRYAGWSTWYYVILMNKETDKDIKIVFTTMFPAIYEY